MQSRYLQSPYFEVLKQNKFSVFGAFKQIIYSIVSSVFIKI
jgi:hypothetical protein